MVKYILLSLIFVHTLCGYSQSLWNKNLTPSPNAASLGMYADVPVSLYSGIPNINIPLYTIKVNGYELPISLSYHASGIKVGQEASWVGLGWSLNAGGVITRSIRGFSDMDEHGESSYPVDKELPSSINDAFLDEYLSQPNYILDGFDRRWDLTSIRLIKDTEPDLFSFNFAGHTGQFMIKKQETPYLDDYEGVQLKAQEPLKILSKGLYNWVIQTADGIKYTFDKQEQKNTITGVGPIAGTSLESKRSHNYITTWYLSKIELVNGEIIEFIYEEEFNSYKGPSFTSENEFTLLYATPNNPKIAEMRDPSYLTRSEDYLEMGQRLKEIKWNQGRILFLANDRLDITGELLGDTPKKLSDIQIYHVDNPNAFRLISLSTSYFGNADLNDEYNCSNNLRLKLNSVSIGSQSQAVETYQFEYSQVSFPPKNSYSIDYWGYNNGVMNSMLCPAYVSPIEQIFKDKNGEYVVLKKDDFVGGANRFVGDDYIQMGILKKITYPTGGYCSFEFEPNDYATSEKIPENYYQSYEWEMPTWSIKSTTLSLSQETTVFFSIDFKTNLPQYEDKEIVICTGNILNEQKKIIETFPLKMKHKEDMGMRIGRYLKLPAGVYTIEFSEKYYPCSIKLSIEYDRLKPISSRKGGGLRISKITTPDVTKSYSYTLQNNTTSGKLLSPMSFAAFHLATYANRFIPVVNINSGINGYHCFFLMRTSGSYTPLESATTGVAVGYSNIKVTTSDTDKTFVEEYVYHNEEEEVNKMLNSPNKINIRNGNLLEERKYDETHHLVQKIIYTYPIVLRNEYIFKAIKSDVLNLGFYNIPIQQCPLNVKYTTNYFYNDSGSLSDSIQQFESYKYNQHYIVNEIYTANSDNQSSIKTIRYASDFNTGIYQAMNDKFMISTKVEEILKNVNHILSATLTTYNLWGNQYLPAMIYQLQEKENLEQSFQNSLYTGTNISPLYDSPIVRFEQYDSKGNILSVLENENERTIYIWSYHYQYPVAEIRNTTLAEVKSKGVDPEIYGKTNNPDMNKLNSLRTSLPNAEVKTYQYKPLIGLISSTDSQGITTYFEYDDYGRLQYIKDRDKHVLKKYEYNLQHK